MRPTILSCVLALAACGKAESSAPKPVASPDAAPAPAPVEKPRPASKTLPPGPAEILAVDAYDPCSLVPAELLARRFGGEPTGLRRQRLNADALRRDEESAIRCEWRLGGKRAEVKFGSEHATGTAGDKKQEDVPGLGEAAWFVKGFSDEVKLRVKVGDRFLSVQSGGLGEPKAVAVELATAALAALPTVAPLNEKLRTGELVGGPAVKVCELMTPEALAAAAGGGTFVVQPDEQSGPRKLDDRVGCAWVTRGERSAEVELSTAASWDDLVPRAKEPDRTGVAGHEALFSTSVGTDLYVKMDGYTLRVSVNDVDTPVADKRARLVPLAEAVIARLPK